MAIIATSSTTNSITAWMADLDTIYSYSDRCPYWYLDGDYQGTSFIPANASSGGKITFTGLKSNTAYEIYVWFKITTPSGTKEVEFWGSAKTESLGIDPWDWNSSNGSATAAQTRAAYNAVTNQGRLNNFSYLVWNDMVDKVWEIAQAALKKSHPDETPSWNINNGNCLSYGNTKMSATDKVLTALRFNSLKYNIGYIYPTGISDVFKGDVVLGSYFTTLTQRMNEWLSTL